MFDKYIVVPESLRNVTDGSKITGYAVDLRLPYYRGLELSAITVKLTVDGEPIDAGRITLRVHGNEYPLALLGNILHDRWAFTEAATLIVEQSEGLTPGEHEVSAYVHVRIAYHHPGFEGRNTKQLLVHERVA